MWVGEKYGGKVGGKVIKQRKLLQLRIGRERASWSKSNGKGKLPNKRGTLPRGDMKSHKNRLAQFPLTVLADHVAVDDRRF